MMDRREKSGERRVNRDCRMRWNSGSDQVVMKAHGRGLRASGLGGTRSVGGWPAAQVLIVRDDTAKLSAAQIEAAQKAAPPRGFRGSALHTGGGRNAAREHCRCARQFQMVISNWATRP